MCPAAYREALIRALSSAASPEPAPGQGHDAGAGRGGDAGRPLPPRMIPRPDDPESAQARAARQPPAASSDAAAAAETARPTPTVSARHWARVMAGPAASARSKEPAA
jgi:hypothetical protein